MSRTGSDPFDTGNSKGPVKNSMEEVERLEALEKKGQWARCRDVGLTVHIHSANSIWGKHDAWILADEVEKYLTPKLGPDISADAEGQHELGALKKQSAEFRAALEFTLKGLEMWRKYQTPGNIAEVEERIRQALGDKHE